MGILKDCINNKKIDSIPVWFMRQAGRYLPEFRQLRSIHNDFIKLCLNPEVSKEITLQPLKRFPIDAAIIFSDILLIPFALGQDVSFEKNFGPRLGELNIKKLLNVSNDEIIKKLKPVYEMIEKTSKDKTISGKDLIGFTGGTWTLLVYMLNQKSPKNLNQDIFKNANQKEVLEKIINAQKIHIKNQIENGVTIIQIFDSWAGLLDESKLDKYIYEPTVELVNYIKSLGVEVICFPRNIKDYKNYCKIIKPNAVSIDYNVDPIKIAETVEIPIQGGLDPKCLLLNENDMLKSAKKYLNIFKNHKYIFNLGHGVVPETDPKNLKILVDFVKEFK